MNLPDKIGKYRIINEVGRGSTGTVYLSHDAYYGRDVAIKLYSAEISGEDEGKARNTRKMFFTEAQMVGHLHHPNILPIYDAGVEKDRYYVVMEHVHGARTLATSVPARSATVSGRRGASSWRSSTRTSCPSRFCSQEPSAW